MSLRIIWAGPWNERSCIAAFGLQMVAELAARGHLVEVVRTELEPDASLTARPSAVPTRWWRDVSIHELRRDVDAVIVNFGDSYSGCGAMLDNFADAGVVGIFHDRILARLADSWVHDTSPDPYARLRRMVDVTYGSGAWRKGPFLASADAVMHERPMLEWFAAGVCGAITADAWAAGRARRSSAGPVQALTAAAQFAELEPKPPSAAGEFVIAMLGADEDTRHIDGVVQGIGESDRLRRTCRLKFVGYVEGSVRSRVLRSAARLRMLAPSLCAWASTEELPALLSDVDAVICTAAFSLEHPSPWAVLALSSARPAIVFVDPADWGIPQDCVLASTPANSAADVRTHLEWILDNPSAAYAMSERASAFARRTYTPARYVDMLLPLVQAAVANRPVMMTGQALGRTLASFGVEPDDPAVRRIGGVLSGMLGSPD